jgi:chromosome segregation ATPase
MQLIAEVRRAIAPIDAFEIKEQVADLVVERLDSRFAVRDKAFNIDTVTSNVTTGISELFQDLNIVPSTLSDIATAQKIVERRQGDLSDSQSQILSSLANIPEEISSRIDKIIDSQSDAFDKLHHSISSIGPDANILSIKDSVETLSLEQKSMSEQHQITLVQTQTIAEKLNALPTEISDLVKGLETSLVDVVASKDNSRRELEDLRKLNTEYQVQVAKARGNYGQVRVEKDVLAGRLADVESDRDRLRTQNKELQESAANKESERSALETRNSELEDALSKALSRLQSVDVVTQAKESSINSLEKSNAELSTEKHDLKAKVTVLIQITASPFLMAVYFRLMLRSKKSTFWSRRRLPCPKLWNPSRRSSIYYFSNRTTGRLSI